MATEQETPPKKPVNKKRRRRIILLSILAVLIIARLILPTIVLHYVNKTLANIKGYYGHVEDVDIALIRGAYKLNNLRIDKVDTVTHKHDSIPFFTAPVIDLSVEWHSIFKGKIVGEIDVDSPVLNFVAGKHKNENVKQDTTSFQATIRKLMPLTINHFTINNGQMHFIDPYNNPRIDLPMKNIKVEAKNLSNVNDSAKVLPASMIASADVFGGKFNMNMRLNPLEKKPTFDLNAGIDNVNMTYLNDFLVAYANFRVDKGTFGLYTEFAAKDGAFRGYVKPLIRDMEVSKDGESARQVVWEYIVAGASEVFKNQRKDQVATKVPIEGRFDDPNTGLWTAVSYVLRNAFVAALRPSVDNEIDIGNVQEPEKKGFFDRLFDKKKKGK